jgi:sugar phosphate isomerase/epimerase
MIGAPWVLTFSPPRRPVAWHFCAGNSIWADLERVPLDDIAYIQFADALAPASDSLARETMHRRALPGEGVLELDRFAATLLYRGWRGTVSVEVLNAELRELPADVLTRRLHAPRPGSGVSNWVWFRCGTPRRRLRSW